MPDFAGYVRSRLGALRVSPEKEQDVIDELVGQLEDTYADLVDSGYSEDEAHRRALHQLDSLEEMGRTLNETLRPSTGAGMRPATTQDAFKIGGSALLEFLTPVGRAGATLGGIGRDLAYAARSLAKRFGYAAGVALTLALGIGATTAVYAIVDGVLLRPLPYEDPATLVRVGTLEPGEEWVEDANGLQNLVGMSLPDALDLRERARSFSDLHIIRINWSMLNAGGRASERDRVGVAWMSAGLFEMLGVTPALGRTLLSEENDVTMSELGVIITHGAWQRRFGGDPEVIGRRLEGLPLSAQVPVTVVGVLPPNFNPPRAVSVLNEAPEFWIPIRLNGVDADRTRRREQGVHVLGRLASGVSVEQARAELGNIAAALATEHPTAGTDRFGRPFGIGLNTFNADYAQSVGSARNALALFLAAAGLLLLLAALNSATLVLVRSMDRIRELGVRTALGASRTRLMRLLAGEAGIVSLVGGGLGVLLAYGGVAVFVAYAPEVMTLPRLDAVGIDARVVMAAAVVSIGAVLIVGFLPALRVTRLNTWNHLQRSGRSFHDSSPHLRGALVATQIALSLVLLSGAGLLFNSFVKLRSAELGFDTDGLTTMKVTWTGVPSVPAMPLEDRPYLGEIVWDLLLDEIRAVPGVESAGIVSDGPFEPPGLGYMRLLMPDEAPSDGGHDVHVYQITPGYLEAMRIDVLAGRAIGAQDGRGDERVILVNETLARTLLRDADPLGAMIRWSALTEQPAEWVPDTWRSHDTVAMRVVGVVEDVVQEEVGESPRPAAYVPHTQGWVHAPRAMIRSSLPFEMLAPQLRAAAARYNPAPDTLWDGPREITPPDGFTLKFQTTLIGAFALIAALLAVAGLYGTMAYSVRLRQRDFGVRMALGADRGGLLRLVLGQGMRLTAIGISLGLLATLLTTRALSTFLFEVEPYDPVTLLAVGVALAVVAAGACFLPARRATTVDPVRVLAEQ